MVDNGCLINDLPYEIIQRVLMFAMEPDPCKREDFRTKPAKVCKLWRDISMSLITSMYRKPYIDWIRSSKMQWTVDHNYALMRTFFVGENLFFDYGLGKCSHLKRSNFGKFGKYFSEYDIRVRCDSDAEIKYISFIKFIMILLYTTTCNKTKWYKNSIVFEYNGFSKESFNRDGILNNLGSGFLPGCHVSDISCDLMAIRFQTCVIILRRVVACHYDPLLTFKNVKKCFFSGTSLYILTTHLSLYFVEHVGATRHQHLSECVYDIAKNNKPQAFDILAVKGKEVVTYKGTSKKRFPMIFTQMMGPKPILYDISVTNGLFMMYRTTKKWVLYDIRKGCVVPSILGHKKEAMFISDGLFFYRLVNNSITRL